LQCIMILWFVMIAKVAYKVLTGQGAEEPRSDDEDGDEGDGVKRTRHSRTARSISSTLIHSTPASTRRPTLKARF